MFSDTLSIAGIFILFFSGFWGPGGSLYFRPLAQVVFDFDALHAFGVAQVMTAGASIATTGFHWLWQVNHPLEPARILGYYLMLIFPANLAGDIVGAYLADVVPRLLQLIVLSLLCSYASFILLRRAVKTAEAEKIGSTTCQSVVLPMEIGTLRLLGEYTFTFFTYTVFIFIRGAKHLSSIAGLKMCSGVYWIVTSVEFTALIITSIWHSHAGDRFLIVIAFFEGALVKMVGIPVGSIMKPILITFTSAAPVQASATTSMLVACISTSNSIAYLVSGFISPETLLLPVFTFAGCLAGLKTIELYLKNKGSRSRVQYVLAVIFAIGGCFNLVVDSLTYARLISASELLSLVC